jgi:hypothetical protein
VIAKHVCSPSGVTHQFARLTKYLIDEQFKQQRVGEVRVTNCYSDEVVAGMLEVLNTQARNTRASPDRTYHLLISFRPGEEVDGETLARIEDRVCTALGFSEHQRISVVHHDTDNLHVHIAINKIHPTRFTIHTPYRDYHTLAVVCERLEAEYGLAKDNHQARKTGAENRADDMEAHSGVESLLRWIKRECADQIRAAKTWAELHQVLSDHGLEIRKRADGLVFVDASGTMVRASAVDRGFSQGRLEARLGSFEAAAGGRPAPQPSKSYEKKRYQCGINTAELYARYKSEQENRTHARAAACAKARDRKNRLIERAKRNGRLKRAFIKPMTAPRLAKKFLYSTISTTLLNQIAAIHTSYLHEREGIYGENRRMAWADWLREQASRGDKDALQALRSRPGATRAEGNGFGSHQKPIRSRSSARSDGVTKRGTVIYSCGKTAVRDDGDRLSVSREADHAGLCAALQMAQERYGAQIAVRGSLEFRERVAFAAVAGKLEITFDDKALELRRRELVRSMNSQARGEARSARDAAHVERGGEAVAGRWTGRPYKPEPGTGHRPRPDATVKATAARARTGAVAAAKYVHDREQKRARIFDISKHSLYTSNDGSAMTYGGMRNVDGQALALLRQGDEIKVLPVDQAVARRLKHIALGTPMVVTPDGVVKTKGRSR